MKKPERLLDTFRRISKLLGKDNTSKDMLSDDERLLAGRVMLATIAISLAASLWYLHKFILCLTTT